jgi:roadblock/LC7 domain-containing protein
MAVDLNRLMGLGGAVSAGEFGVDGHLISYKGDLSREHAEMIAMMCAANCSMGRMQAEGFTRYTGMKWTPFKGWAVSAGDFTVCVMGNAGVFVETAKADFNDIYRTLSDVAPLKEAA